MVIKCDNIDIKDTYLHEKIKNRIDDKGYFLINSKELSNESLLKICYGLGDLFSSKYSIIDVKADSEKKGITLTNQEVYPHNECAYSEIFPSKIVLYCRKASKKGRFYLINSKKIIEKLGVLIDELETLEVTINSPRNNSKIRKKILQINGNQEKFLSYSSIYLQTNYLSYEFKNDYLPLSIERLNKLLLDVKNREYHYWNQGDLLIFDNKKFLHGRESFNDKNRHLVHIRIK